jgi:bacterioferritin-associated ferredoxin
MGNRPSRPSIEASAQKFNKSFGLKGEFRFFYLELLEDYAAQKVQLTDEEIRAVVKKIMELGDAYQIFYLLKIHFAQKVQLTDEEIRAAVKKTIETGNEYRSFDLLRAHFARCVQLTDEEIRVAVKKTIETGNEYRIFNLLRAHFSQRVQLTDEEIRAAVKKTIETEDESRIFKLLKAHFVQRVQLTDEEIWATVRKLLYGYECDPDRLIYLRENYFSKLTQMQIVIIAKEMVPSEMSLILMRYSQALDSNQFQWIVEARPPLRIWPFWQEYRTMLSQEKLIIVEKKVIDDERQKLIAILRAVSKDFGCFQIFVEYLVLASWQDLKYLLPESDV